LQSLLEENESKSLRERLTLIRLYEELRGFGYEGSYAAVRRYAIGWRKNHASATANAYVPLMFAPGEAYQFDWSHEIVLLDGVTTIVKVAHVRLCHSRMMLARAYPRDTQEMVFDAHERAFAFFRGALRARHLRQHEVGGGNDFRWQGSSVQSPLSPDVLAPSRRGFDSRTTTN
jgi:transposase